MPRPRDVTNGLLGAQGHQVFHFGFALAAMVIRYAHPAKSAVICDIPDDTGRFLMPNKLNHALVDLIFIHTLCGALLLTGDILGKFSLHWAHLLNFFNVLTIPVYQYFIFQAWTVLKETNKQVKE